MRLGMVPLGRWVNVINTQLSIGERDHYSTGRAQWCRDGIPYLYGVFNAERKRLARVFLGSIGRAALAHYMPPKRLK